MTSPDNPTYRRVLRRRWQHRPALGMLDRRREQRAAIGLPEDRQEMWEAMNELHGGRACTICGTYGWFRGMRTAGPAPDPQYTRQ